MALEWGERIRAFRIGRGTFAKPDMSQQDLADLVGVRSTTVSRWEQGQMVPTLDHQLALAKAFGVPPAVLFTLPAS